MLPGPVKDISDRLSASGNLGSKPDDFPPGTPGLKGIGNWLFDEGSGDVATDASGNDHDLALKGAPAWVEGKAGKALQFSGNQSAESSGPVLDTSGNYSVSSSVKLDGTGGGFSTAMSQDGDSTSAFFLQYDGSANKFAFSTASGRAYADTRAKAGQWYHLVGCRCFRPGCHRRGSQDTLRPGRHRVDR